MKQLTKKALSDVVTTVFLILISIVAVVIVANIIIGNIKGDLKEGTDCFDLRDYLSIVSSDYTCSNSSETRVMIERGGDNYTIAGLYVSILVGGNSQGYEIIEPSSPGVRIITRTGATSDLELPKPGEARTYLFDRTNGEKVSLGVKSINGKVCDMETYQLEPCNQG